MDYSKSSIETPRGGAYLFHLWGGGLIVTGSLIEKGELLIQFSKDDGISTP